MIITTTPHPGVCLITLARPKVNALNNELLALVVETLEQHSAKNPVAVITGNQAFFSAGADLAQLIESTPVDQLKDPREALWKRLWAIPYPVVAAVGGLCLGGGHELAMSCDIAIAADNAEFGQPEVNVGLTPGAGGTQRLARCLGKAKAMYHCLTGERISARRAFEWGLVAKVVPTPALLGEALELAKKLADQPPIALRLIKESINQSFETPLSAGLSLERRNFYLTFASRDQKEGGRAFLDKRTPKYLGV